MLQVDEVGADWSVLVAMNDAETLRLLSVVLDGFGYTTLECYNRDEVFEKLSDNSPSMAVVDAQMEGAEEICTLFRGRGGVSLMILLDGREKPDRLKKRLNADAWESISAGPEKILLALRKLAKTKGEAE